MPTINKTAVLNPFSNLEDRILDYIPRATTSKFGIVAIGSGLNIDALGRIYSDAQVLEYLNVAAFPATGETGKIYVETTGNTTYRWSGTGYVKITSGEVSSVAGKTGVVTLTKGDVGLSNVDNTADSAKNVASAAKLTTARTIGGVSFDGTANINLPGVNATGNQNTSGNAASATKLATARTINGVSFDGSSNIIIGEPTFANPLATYTSGDANALSTGSFNVRYLQQTAINKPTGTDHAIMTLNYSAIWSGQQAFDWRTGNVFTRTQNNGTWLNWATQVDTRNYATTLPIFSVNGVGLVPARVGSTTTKFLREDGTWVVPADTTYVAMTEANANAGTETTARLITAAVLKSAIQTHSPVQTDVTGNAATATKLQTSRQVSFSGSVSGSGSFDGSSDLNIPLNLTGVETVYTTTNPSLLVANGTIHFLTLTANGVLSCDIENGQSITVLIPATSYLLDLSGFTVANHFTNISTTSITTLVLANVNGVKYLYGTSKD